MLHDELLADARREAEHARSELLKARMLLANLDGLLTCREGIKGHLALTPPEERVLAELRAFMRETTLYPKAEATK